VTALEPNRRFASATFQRRHAVLLDLVPKRRRTLLFSLGPSCPDLLTLWGFNPSAFYFDNYGTITIA
jgi:hypothetical protein